MTKITATAVALLAAFVAAGAARAAEHEVKMLSRGCDGRMMVFEPAFLKVAPGDTVTFVAADKGHNAQSIDRLLPEGADPFRGRMNRDVSVAFDAEGVCGVKCMPHYAMGMMALIQVGDDLPNLDAAASARLPGKAGPRLAELLGNVQGAEHASAD